MRTAVRPIAVNPPVTSKFINMQEPFLVQTVEFRRAYRQTKTTFRALSLSSVQHTSICMLILDGLVTCVYIFY